MGSPHGFAATTPHLELATLQSHPHLAGPCPTLTQTAILAAISVVVVGSPLKVNQSRSSKGPYLEQVTIQAAAIGFELVEAIEAIGSAIRAKAATTIEAIAAIAAG